MSSPFRAPSIMAFAAACAALASASPPPTAAGAPPLTSSSSELSSTLSQAPASTAATATAGSISSSELSSSELQPSLRATRVPLAAAIAAATSAEPPAPPPPRVCVPMTPLISDSASARAPGSSSARCPSSEADRCSRIRCCLAARRSDFAVPDSTSQLPATGSDAYIAAGAPPPPTTPPPRAPASLPPPLPSSVPPSTTPRSTPTGTSMRPARPRSTTCAAAPSGSSCRPYLSAVLASAVAMSTCTPSPSGHSRAAYHSASLETASMRFKSACSAVTYACASLLHADVAAEAPPPAPSSPSPCGARRCQCMRKIAPRASASAASKLRSALASFSAALSRSICIFRSLRCALEAASGGGVVPGARACAPWHCVRRCCGRRAVRRAAASPRQRGSDRRGCGCADDVAAVRMARMSSGAGERAQHVRCSS
mmetsp:Transcript_23928/g.71014  ORF Transcript_23928/g.71014 Transcript_23928/m.71014 type:complete len:428 (+) Transcript_23928:746-2029(+)